MTVTGFVDVAQKKKAVLRKAEKKRESEKINMQKNEKNRIKCENHRTLNRKKCVNIET